MFNKFDKDKDGVLNVREMNTLQAAWETMNGIQKLRYFVYVWLMVLIIIMVV